MHLKALALASVIFALPAFAQNAPAPVATLAKAVDIPFQTFTLPNGLRVIVHTDRKAPIVAVSVWYDVGSKHEPAGKTGFAHLFEHLMFNGSENAPGDFFEPLKQVGATDYNGTTNFDRTNYFENVPTAAIDRALFLESDRMGHLTGAITQAVLDEQRGVVQNEKRERDNQPYGLVSYKLFEGLFANHPYGHLPIGSMADLDRASLADVKTWFRAHYGPNNAVLVLAGDIDLATARAKVTRYFGDIARGPDSAPPVVNVPTLVAPVSETMQDRVAATLIVRSWAVPGLNDPAAPALDVAGAVLGGMAASRLDTALVRREKIAVSASAGYSDMAQVGMFSINVVVREGVDPLVVGRRIDAILADLARTGPTADEVQRVVAQAVAGRIRGLEPVGGKASALAQGALFSDDPAHYKAELAALAMQTPASVKRAMDMWLTRPAYSLTVVKGERGAYAEAVVPPKVEVKAAPETPVLGRRGPLPAVGALTGLTFPDVERARLSNGIELIYAQRGAVPITRLSISFDAGTAADVAGRLGTQQLTLNLLHEGTTRLNGIQIAEARQRLGAAIGTGFSPDRTNVSLDVPSANLAPGLDLFADIVRNPAFAPAEVARVKTQQLAGIAQELTSPDGIAQRVLPRYAYAEGSPYRKASGGGDPAAVAKLTRADLIAFQQAWLRPDKAKIFVVSDLPLTAVRAAIEARFGDWTPVGAAGVKTFAPAGDVAQTAKIVLIDRPDSPQSLIYGVQRVGLPGSIELLPYTVANDALGGSFLGRINMDLRETRHWSYGASGSFQRNIGSVAYILRAPVQADKTGPAVAAVRQDIADYLAAKPMTPGEFSRAINGGIRALPGSFESSYAVLGAMQQNDLLGRPDDYFAGLTRRYEALTLPQATQAIRSVVDPARMTWIVVGDAKVVKPQLDTLGMPVEVLAAASVTGMPVIPVRPIAAATSGSETK
ncbi:pitrilysin family protein [Sphingomonas sp.]|jgi:predicted Zn-dependent peptidase|uniref:M16 family metallopeptidase n=1 Tax=Sphingomonas sp. TaxID=28214 RepID=UPI002ED99232